MLASVLTAGASVPQFGSVESDVIAQASADAPRRMAPRAVSQPREVAADYDCNYYWLSSNGAISDTWETSIVEIVEGESANEYLIKNFLADTFRPEGDSSFATDDIRAVYDPESGALTIPCGQPLFVRSEGGTDMQIGIYSLSRSDKGWKIGLDGELVLAPTDTGFALAAISQVQGFYIGCYNEASGRFSGYGGVLYPDFCEFNGVMLYQVTPDEDTEMIPWLNDIYTEVNEAESTVSIRNFANFGYDVVVTFTYDLRAGRAEAINPLLGVLYDTEGVQNPYYGCDASAEGAPLRDADERYVLTADIGTDARGNAVLNLPLWAAFMGERWLGLYGSTTAMLFMPLPEPESGLGGATVAGDDEAPVYYDLQGCRLDAPRPGSIVICRRGDSVKKTILR